MWFLYEQLLGSRTHSSNDRHGEVSPSCINHLIRYDSCNWANAQAMFAIKSEIIDKCDALMNFAAEIHIPSHSMSSSRAQLRITVKGKRHSAVPPAQS